MFYTQDQVDKDQLIDALLQNELYKMPDGRQFYEASEEELELLICSTLDLPDAFCSV
ncbi:Fur-regulated basic protein FbpA [Desertibacillus haloalkaliphilus]|uniref:Fur-regulated basic protein FbpA n=1 Tax=Desertibacillus haloalkaliphilus TaxID=1328930 RepID=UPI001C25C9C0|nr:Fur-regulated basic protein FbpA [Desertibacillus haloalkaliphilus]MBU8907601.1 Fur-regulated basic protein FbpA [Desertibacillus haloalkaliphilus]